MNRFIVLTCTALAILGCAGLANADPTKHECVAANDRGQDARQTGKLAEARERFTLCVAASCPQPVREDCARRLDELSKATPSVAFDAKDGAGSDLSAVHVTVDGRLLAERLDGAAIDVDPGEHKFIFEVAGRPPVEKTLVLHEGEKARRISVAFGAPLAAQGASTQPGVDQPGISTRRALAIAVAGAGAVGLAIGIGSGVASSSKHSTLDAECHPDGSCPTSAQSDLNGFRSLRTVSTIGYIVGGVGLAGGVVLWFTAPSHPGGKTAAVWFGPGSVGVGGRF